MKCKSFKWLVFFRFLVLAFAFVCVAVSCASTNQAGKTNSSYSGKLKTNSDTGKNNNPPKPSTKIPDAGKRNFFSSVDSSIMDKIEKGSPDSLRSAVSEIRSLEINTDEKVQVLLVIAAGIMQNVWHGERITWDIPPIGTNTPYAGALSSVRQGIYDRSTGNVDFLATLLPSLVIPAARRVSEFSDEAESALLACVEAKPDSVIALYLLGLLYQKTDDCQKAVNYFNRALSGDPNNRIILYAKALCLEHLGYNDDAFSIGQSLLMQRSNDVNALKLCTRISFKQKNWNMAEEYVGRVLQQEPNNREYVLFRIQILMAREDYIHAASLLDVYSRQDSTSREYYLLRARLQYSWSRNTNAAVSTVEQAMSRYPDDPEILILAAELASMTGTSVAGQSAGDLAEKILEKDAGNTAAREFAVRGLIQNKEWQKAYDESSRLRSSVPGNKTYSLLHITICLALDKDTEAWNLVQELYKENSRDIDVLQSYITVLAETGKSVQALALISENLNTTNTSFKSFLYYRRSFLHNNQDDALADLRSSLISNPRNNDALFRLYQIYFNAKEYRRAQYYLRQIVALNPSDTHYLRLNEELNALIK